MSTQDENAEKNNKIGVILAIIAGLLALGMTFAFMKKMQQNAQHATVAERNSVDYKRVLAAKRDLPANHKLDLNNDLIQINVPKDRDFEVFYRNCISAEYASELQGRAIVHAIPANYPLLYSSLTTATRLEDVFHEGFLKTISLSTENFFSSHLIPGDRVDILITEAVNKEPKSIPAANIASPSEVMAAAMQPILEMASDGQNGQAKKMVTRIILENAEVFMVGPSITKSREMIGVTPPENVSSNEITFRLNRDDAIMLTNYANSGAKISLLLRPRVNKGDGNNAPTAVALDNDGKGGKSAAQNYQSTTVKKK